MDSITAATIVAAVTADVAAGTSEASKKSIADAYNALKEALNSKYGANSDLAEAIEKIEPRPESLARRALLEEEVASTGVDKDREILPLVEKLQQALNADPEGAATYQNITVDRGYGINSMSNYRVQRMNVGDFVLGHGKNTTITTTPPTRKQDDEQ